MRARTRSKILPVAAALAVGVCLTACVTVAEHRKLEAEVLRLKKHGAVGSDARANVADLAERLDALDSELALLRGRMEVVEHRAGEALEEAREARRTAHGAAAASPSGGSGDEPPTDAAGSPEELRAYREAYAAWRADDNQTCVDRFREFLQTHPSSEYADDAAFWMADCHFKQGDYRTAVLRFDDVAGRYPTGNKAADALYRQGEALIKLGYGEAAVKAFERVVNEYPDSPRAGEAKRQVKLLRASG